jgi:hypothetical protein
LFILFTFYRFLVDFIDVIVGIKGVGQGGKHDLGKKTRRVEA